MCALSATRSNLSYSTLPAPVRRFFDDQFHRSYRLIADMRHPTTGLYYDAYVSKGQRELPSSIAATGVGLIALAIGDYVGWETDAVSKAILTLRAMACELPGVAPAKDAQTGFLAHFIDVNTGARRWGSENSTIDTALLVSGALFARQYFTGNQEIARLAAKLYRSIHWEAAIANPETGEIYLEIEQGEGIKPLAPYNEYSILAHVARHTLSGRRLWQQVYDPKRLHLLPSQEIGPGRQIICEENNIPSSFVYQFPFYLVHEYTQSSVYQELYANIAFADHKDWMERHKAPSFIWGHGAGVTPKGCYHPDAIGNNPEAVASPYIIAGFLPIYPAGIFDLYDIYRTVIPYDKAPLTMGDATSRARFQAAYKYGLTRFQHKPSRPSFWYPQHTALIDWSSMLYGLTAFKHGIEFFAQHNQIDDLALAS